MHPESSFEETDDLGGIVSTGQPPDIARNLISFARLGVIHFIIDLRTQFNVWETLHAHGRRRRHTRGEERLGG